ncbi:MAG: FHA domain-containing protein [Vicinamibacterales bacterium]|jgi:pSer/pThr/pTyr-binding forkhead associated (FHA) protein
MWTLQSIDPADVELTFRLLPGTLKTMGRAPRADFVVDAALVSRVHCRFTLSEANELELEDLGSTNGTFVNGRKVIKATLSDGDKLTVGRVEFVVNAESNAQRAGSPKTTWSM